MPCVSEPRQEALRPPPSVGAPNSLLGHGADIRLLHLTLRSDEVVLSVCQLAGQIIEPSAEFLDQCLGGGQARGQSGDFNLLGGLSMAVLDLLNDMRPIDLIADRL